MVEVVQGSLLVVDDNEMNRDMLARRLTRRGYTVAVAEDGHQALQMIEAQPFDLVLLDIMMPGISGLEVLKRLRQQHSMANLPVIMTTAKDQSVDIVSALQLEANDYITKPIDFPVLLARVLTQLALGRAHKENQQLAEQLERRNQFIRETFGRYLTNDVVTNLLDSPAGLRLGGEKRRVTMLMSDLRGFTSMTERLAPERVMTILNRYLGTMAEIITHHEGTIDEFIGDAIFVIFGAPNQRENDAQRAVACAVAMQLAMDTINAQHQCEGLPDLEMGIGVHTGDVVVGNIGSDKRAKYGVVGNHVNLTSRIESYTIGGQILISDAVKQAVGPVLRITKQMEIEAKGIDLPITLHEVQGIGGDYSLFLAEQEHTLILLPEAVPLRYTVLEGKRLDADAYTGRFMKLSAKGGEIYSDASVALWNNLKIQLLSANREAPPGHLYAKVVDHLPEPHPGFVVHFTSISPEITTFLQGLSA